MTTNFNPANHSYENKNNRDRIRLTELKFAANHPHDGAIMFGSWAFAMAEFCLMKEEVTSYGVTLPLEKRKETASLYCTIHPVFIFILLLIRSHKKNSSIKYRTSERFTQPSLGALEGLT